MSRPASADPSYDKSHVFTWLLVPLCRSESLAVGAILVLVLVVLVLVVLILVVLILIVLVVLVLILIVLILVLVVHRLCDAFSHGIYSGIPGRSRRLADAPPMWYCLTKGTVIVCRLFLPLIQVRHRHNLHNFSHGGKI